MTLKRIHPITEEINNTPFDKILILKLNEVILTLNELMHGLKPSVAYEEKENKGYENEVISTDPNDR